MPPLTAVTAACADMNCVIFPRGSLYLQLRAHAEAIEVQRLRQCAKLPADLRIDPAPKAPDYEELEGRHGALLQPSEVPGGHRLPVGHKPGQLQQGLNDVHAKLIERARGDLDGTL
eukprot:8689835-Pyramimonas_sp.AAC.1